MKLKWINANNLDKNLKATAHKSGKLGFTMEAANKLNLEYQDCAKIAINEGDSTDKSLYVVFSPSEVEGAFKVSKAGEYYYLNTKHLFDSLGIDYKAESVVYDIVKYDGEDRAVELYTFKRREIKKKTAPVKTGAASMS